jgi:hypothetical protein
VLVSGFLSTIWYPAIRSAKKFSDACPPRRTGLQVAGDHAGHDRRSGLLRLDLHGQAVLGEQALAVAELQERRGGPPQAVAAIRTVARVDTNVTRRRRVERVLAG